MASIGGARGATAVSLDARRDASNLSLVAQPKRAEELHP